MAEKEKINGKTNIISKKVRIILVIIGLFLVVSIIVAIAIFSAQSKAPEAVIEQLESGRPEVLVDKSYEEPEFSDDENRTNNAFNVADFGEQGSNGWYYGKCDWNGANFELLSYNAEENRYYDNGKPELKADFVEPGNGRNAAYQWKVAEDGQIRVTGKYTKYPNNDDAASTGVCMRIFHNGTEKKWFGDGINHGGITENVEVTFDETYTVTAGDVIMFAIDPEGNDAWDGGKLEVTITPNE